MNVAEGKYVVREGFVNAFLIPGVLLAIPAIIFLMTNTPVGIALSVCCIVLFSAVSGLEIDGHSKRYRKYHSFFGVRIGKYRSWEAYDQAVVLISTETHQLIGYMGSPLFFGPLGKTKSLTYDLILKGDGLQSVKAYDFLTYRDAAKALAKFEELGLQTEDRVLNKMIEKKKKRR